MVESSSSMLEFVTTPTRRPFSYDRETADAEFTHAGKRVHDVLLTLGDNRRTRHHITHLGGSDIAAGGKDFDRKIAVRNHADRLIAAVHYDQASHVAGAHRKGAVSH